MNTRRTTPALARTWFWQAPWLLLAAWLLWHLWQWGIWHAVFAPDLSACQAMARQGACWGVVAAKGQAWFWGMSTADGSDWQWSGLPLTLMLTAVTLLASIPLAVGLAWGRLSGNRAVRWASTAWIETLRGAPLVMWLFAAAFVLPALLTPLLTWLGLPDWEPGIVMRVAVVMTLFSSAYMAEILRGSLRVIAHDQAEAAEVLGASWWTTQWQVVLPQAFRGAIPALTGHTIGMLKDTSLVTVVSMQDLTGAMAMSLNGDPDWRPFFLEAYLVVALVYAALCLGVSALGRWLEKRYPALGQAQ
jgi:general L-amino acid transport system permease protein